MTGEMIIEAVPVPEERREKTHRPTGLNIKISMKRVRSEDKAVIVKGVMDALEFDPGDYGILAMILMDHKGELHDEASVRVPLTEDLQ